MQQDRIRTGRERKRRRSREQWRAIIGDYEASDLSPGVYCREQGLTPSVFGKWHRVFRSETGMSPFIELPSNLAGVLPPSRAAKDWRVEVDLGGGIVLRLR